MRKALSIAISTAALMIGGSVAGAQTGTPDYDYYVTGAGDQRMVTDRVTGESNPLLVGEVGQPPADCPAGSFWLERRDEGTVGDEADLIRSCDDAQASFGLNAPDTGMAMDNGQPFTEGALIMRPVENPSGSTVGEGTPETGGGG